MNNQQPEESDKSAADHWEHLANETKLMAEHEHKVGISLFPFGDNRVPATHRHRTYMQTADKLRTLG